MKTAEFLILCLAVQAGYYSGPSADCICIIANAPAHFKS